MKSSPRNLILATLLSVVGTLHAAGSALRVTCEGSDVGAEVWINGKFRGECPVDLQVPAELLKLLVRKQVDDDREQLYRQDIRMGEDSIKKVEIKLSAPRLTAEAQKRVEERQAAERAEAQRREAIEQAQALQRQTAERAEAQRRETLAQSARAEFDAGLASGAIKASFRHCADCPEMVTIPPGIFEMGSNDGTESEKPVHSVNIKAFAIGKYEVTQGQWKAVMGNNPSHFSGFFTSCETCPVETISWNDIQGFIQKLNQKTGQQYRLPTEAEWEYACRGGRQQKYCGSDDVNAVAWSTENSAGKTQTVGQKAANGFGLHDMSGNVWEWVQDGSHGNYQGAPSDGGEWTAGADTRFRVLRGGSWDDNPANLRSAIRGRSTPDFRLKYSGFRLARTLFNP
jgi:formylglycine-generating enzyme required for sulfatase activity